MYIKMHAKYSLCLNASSTHLMIMNDFRDRNWMQLFRLSATENADWWPTAHLFLMAERKCTVVLSTLTRTHSKVSQCEQPALWAPLFQYVWNAKKKSRQRWRWALQTPQPEEMENSWGSALPQCRPAPCLLLSGSNQTALGLSKDPVPLFISTVARTPLIGILQLGHGHCLSSAVKSLRLVNVELWSPQMPDWAAPLRYLNASISISSQTRIRLLWIHICCRALCVCQRQSEGTPSKEMQLLFLFMKSKNPKCK